MVVENDFFNLEEIKKYNEGYRIINLVRLYKKVIERSQDEEHKLDMKIRIYELLLDLPGLSDADREEYKIAKRKVNKKRKEIALFKLKEKIKWVKHYRALTWQFIADFLNCTYAEIYNFCHDPKIGLGIRARRFLAINSFLARYRPEEGWPSNLIN